MDILVRIVADGFVVLITGIAGYALLFRVRCERLRTYTSVVLAGITAYAAAKIAALIYQPHTLRPFERMGVDPGAAYLNNPGFPSDHALFASFLTLAVWWALHDKKLTAAMAVLTLTMVVGRVVALVHTPADVVGGLLIAVIGTVWYTPLMQTKLHKLLAKNTKK